MAKEVNHSKKRYYPIRDAENPHKVMLVEITEEVYRAIYPEIWATQKREQYHERCMCTKKYLWKCDGDCDLCEYHAPGDMLSLDEPTEDGNANMYDCIPDNKKTIEEIISDQMLLEELFSRLRELDPEADTIINLWSSHPEGISDRAIARELGRPQKTFADQMKKIRTELRKVRGY